jgi:hypothetical protein
MNERPKFTLTLGGQEKINRIKAFVDEAINIGFFEARQGAFAILNSRLQELEEKGITREELSDALDAEIKRRDSGLK